MRKTIVVLILLVEFLEIYQQDFILFLWIFKFINLIIFFYILNRIIQDYKLNKETKRWNILYIILFIIAKVVLFFLLKKQHDIENKAINELGINANSQIDQYKTRCYEYPDTMILSNNISYKKKGDSFELSMYYKNEYYKWNIIKKIWQLY